MEHRVLLLGLGFWGTNWMRTLSRAGGVEIAGISGAEEDIARISGEFGIPIEKAYVDYREAVQRTDADIVIVAIPTKHHTNAAKLAMSRGMHILSEKPLASSMDEANEIVEFKKNYPRLKYVVDQNYRWRPHNQTIKKAIEDGRIGKIGTMHIEFRQPEDLLGYRQFLDIPLLQDVSIHHFDLTRFFCGNKCKEIYCYPYRPEWSKFQGKPSVEAMIRMEDGIVVNYNATWATRGKETSWDGNITVTGEKGSLFLDANNGIWFFEYGKKQGRLLDKVEMERTELDYALDMLVRCIDNDESPESSLEDNYQSFAMVCAAEESARRNAPVDLRETMTGRERSHLGEVL